MHTYTQEELQQKFWDDAGEVFGYDIIGSDTHPMKKAFETFCKMVKEQRIIWHDDDADDDDDDADDEEDDIGDAVEAPLEAALEAE